jgi:hypothetical protein
VQVGCFGNPIRCALKPQKPGPPPTCPFIYYHNVKEPADKKGHPLIPDIATGGADDLFVDDQTAEMLGTSRPVRGPLSWSSDSVNRLLQFYYK